MASNISVVIPVLDRADFIGAAIASVLSQSEPVDEIIVVDDGSSDATLAVVASFDGVVLKQSSRLGPAGARNVGLAAARSELIAFLDSDDLWVPDALAGLADALEDAAADVAWGLASTELLLGGQLPAPGWPVTLTRLVLIPTMLFRTDALRQLGGFSDDLQFGEDSDFLMRARAAALRIAECEQEVLIYRRHPGNMTNDCPSAKQAWFEVARAAMARRRTSNR